MFSRWVWGKGEWILGGDGGVARSRMSILAFCQKWEGCIVEKGCRRGIDAVLVCGRWHRWGIWGLG